jgi:hypothetical protein
MRLPILLAVGFFLWVTQITELRAQTPSQSALIEAAKKEGKLVWYTSMAVDTSKPLLDAYLKEYPFIKAELVRLGEEQLVNRILSETRAGRWAFDVLSTSSISTMIDRKIIIPYLAPERDLFMDQFKDPQGYWTGVFVNNLVLAYNTKLLAAKDAPKSYEDLLAPKWKGQMLMDSTDYDWYGTLLTVWGREKTVAYMQRLAKQDPLWRRGHGLTAQLVGAGEVPLAWAYNFRIERMKSDGAPVDWVETFDPIVVTISGIALSALSLGMLGLFCYGVFYAVRNIPSGQTALRVGQQAPEFWQVKTTLSGSSSDRPAASPIWDTLRVGVIGGQARAWKAWSWRRAPGVWSACVASNTTGAIDFMRSIPSMSTTRLL